MEQTATDLLTKERRRQRTMVATVIVGLGLVAISSRSERAMFQFGLGTPGVFATLRETGPAMPRVALREGNPAAFFAGLGRFGKPAAEPGNGRVIPAEALERIGARPDSLMFVGPESQLPPGNGFVTDPLNPDVTLGPGTIPLPGSGDPGSRRVISSDGGGGSSSGGGSSTGGGGSSGGTGSSSSGGTDGGSSTGGGSSGGTSSGSSGGDGGSSGGGTPSAVPEPASWVLLIGGFIGVGAMMRRRRKGTPAVA